MRVLGISGSLRAGSHNSKLLRAAGEALPAAAEFEIWEGLRDVPPYDADDDVDPAPTTVAELRGAIARADAVLIATPEYNSSIPGALKNALDWASRPLATNVFRNKPVAVVGATTGSFGAVWAQAELRKVLGAMGARVVKDPDLEVGLAKAQEAFDADGELRDRLLSQRLERLGRTLVAEAEAHLLAA